MKLILQNGQQFRSRGPSTGALTSVNVSPPANFFAVENTGRDGGGDEREDRAIFHLRLIRRYKVSLFVRRRNFFIRRETSNVNSEASKLIPRRAIVRCSRVLNI